MSPVTFLAPSFVVFFAPRTLALRGAPVVVVFRRAEEVVVRLAGFDSPAFSDLVSGEAERAVSLPLPAFRKGEGVRPTTGGVAVREIGGVGRLIAGLSHDEKKSSSGSPAGVEVPSVSAASLITTSPGCLGTVSEENQIQTLHLRLRVPLGTSLQLILVLGSSVGLILCLRILAVQRCCATILAKELGGRLIATNLHGAQLIPLPF